MYSEPAIWKSRCKLYGYSVALTYSMGQSLCTEETSTREEFSGCAQCTRGRWHVIKTASQKVGLDEDRDGGKDISCQRLLVSNLKNVYCWTNLRRVCVRVLAMFRVSKQEA